MSPAEWDGEENQWKYRVLVQRRDLSGGGDQLDRVSSFTNAFTWRSIADFSWLENALRAEYHGALMLPLLSIAIGTSDLANTQYEVDAILLRDWLGDVFNGIRGQGMNTEVMCTCKLFFQYAHVLTLFVTFRVSR